MLHHLPPTAAPLEVADLAQGLRPGPDAVLRFEEALACYLAVPACGLAASGRTALFLLLQHLSHTADHPDRRDVVLPAYTCPAVAKVILDLGLHPRLVDISPSSLAMEAEPLEASINRQTLAVIHVHPFGIPQPLGQLPSMARAQGATLIEDAAQALGSRVNGRQAGTGGDYGLFSLGPGKPLSTGGGGFLCYNPAHHRELAAPGKPGLAAPATPPAVAVATLALLSAAFHPRGWWLATRIGLHRVGDREGSWGYKLRGLNPGRAAIGLRGLGRLDGVNQRRRQTAQQLIDGLQGFDFVHVPPPAAEAEPIYLRLPLVIADAGRRESLLRRLWASGIGAGRLYRRPLSEIFPQLGGPRYRGASYVAEHLLTLPTHHHVRPGDVERMIEVFRAA